jgi:hypothetical protein
MNLLRRRLFASACPDESEEINRRSNDASNLPGTVAQEGGLTEYSVMLGMD